MALCELTESRLLVLHTAASRVGAMDLGCVTEGGVGAALEAEVILNLGADEVEIPAGPFVVYQGSHGDRGRAPGGRDPAGGGLDRGAGHLRQHRGAAADGEPGRVPAGRGAGELGDPAGRLSAVLGQTLPFDSIAELRRRMVAEVPHLGADRRGAGERVDAGRGGRYERRRRLGGWAGAHYLANPVMRASEVMAELARLADARAGQAMAAE